MPQLCRGNVFGVRGRYLSSVLAGVLPKCRRFISLRFVRRWVRPSRVWFLVLRSVLPRSLRCGVWGDGVWKLRAWNVFNVGPGLVPELPLWHLRVGRGKFRLRRVPHGDVFDPGGLDELGLVRGLRRGHVPAVDGGAEVLCLPRGLVLDGARDRVRPLRRGLLPAEPRRPLLRLGLLVGHLFGRRRRRLHRLRPGHLHGGDGRFGLSGLPRGAVW